MKNSSRALLAIALAAVAGPIAPASLEAQKRDRDVITRDELEAAAQKSGDLHRAIRSLRPHMLAGSRGVRSMGIEAGPPDESGRPTARATGRAIPPVVYIDGTKAGDPSMLESILTVNVHEVRFYNPNKALTEYGVGHEGGAILVTLLKQDS